MKKRFLSNRRSCILLLVFISTLSALAWGAQPAKGRDGQDTVLILNSYHLGYAWSDDEQAGIIDVFRGKDKNWVPVVEYLDLKRLPDGRHLTEVKKLFHLKYQNKRFSVVIVMDNPALEFAIDNQEELFRNAPIVFCGINNYSPSMLKGRSDVTGVVESIDIAGTIEVMLRLHPAAREIFSPHDYTATGLAVRKELEALVPRFGARVRFRFTDPLTMEELLKEVERLPKSSLFLEIGFITDKSGRTFGISETTKLFSEHSPVPIYSTYEQRLGFGIVGGKLLSPRIHGTNAAHIALRVLAGEKASATPVVSESDSQFMFDYKVMSRFGIPLSALPENSIVINKPVSYYAAHRVIIQIALVVIFFLLVVIALLMVIMVQRKRSLEVTRQSEELFKVITSSTPDHLLVQDRNLRYSFVMNPQPGLTKQDMIGKTDHDFLSKENADKLAEIKRQVLNTGRPVNAEVPLISSTGQQQFFDGSYVPKFGAKGQIDGLIGYFRNVTERKQAEEKIQASLLEKETMLKEIHHRVKNNLQVISSLLDLQSSYLQDAKAREALQASMTRVRTMAMIHTQLYQSQDLARIDFRVFIQDLVGNIRQSYGRAASPVEINVDADEMYLNIDTSIPCGLILNELVSNALKHAFPGGRNGEINIRMRLEEGQGVLTVQDNGIGFPESIDLTNLKSLGLELVNIWVRQMNGKIDIQAHGGTAWTITFPLKNDRKWCNG